MASKLAQKIMDAAVDRLSSHSTIAADFEFDVDHILAEHKIESAEEFYEIEGFAFASQQERAAAVQCLEERDVEIRRQERERLRARMIEWAKSSTTDGADLAHIFDEEGERND